MEEKYKSDSFKKLLDRLQEDSWQLELLISAFAIFGLFYSLEPIAHSLQLAQFDNNNAFLYFFIIVHFALQILIFNLLLHVLLRAMWIGSLGLRYVFGDIDYDKLNYSELFTKYLKKNVGSFDSNIHTLENVCSVIFALTFLLIFYIFSFFVISFMVITLNNPIPDWMLYIVRILFLLIAFGSLLTFIDFITQGLLKKNKWVAKIYFPFYWLFSFITLSFLYRPMVYNLLDNKYGKRISLLLIPFYILIYVAFHLQFQKSNFITPASTKLSTRQIANGRNYSDELKKDEMLITGDFVIQSKVVSEPYLKIFVPLTYKIEDELMDFDSNLKPKKDKRGLYFQSEITIAKEEPNYDSLSTIYLRAFEKKFFFKIDETPCETHFIIANNEGILGFESYTGIKDISEGKHIIQFLKFKSRNTDSILTIQEVPFWHFKP